MVKNSLYVWLAVIFLIHRMMKGGLEIYGNTGMACFFYFPVAESGNMAQIWREKTATGTGI